MTDEKVVERVFEGEPVKVKVGLIPEGLTQASGVTPLEGLNDDVVLLIGDKDVMLAQISQSTHSFNNEIFIDRLRDLQVELQNSIEVNDMEDIAWDKDRSMAFIIVSGSKNSDNEKKKKREKLVRLAFDAGNKVTGAEKAAFKADIVAAFPELAPSVENHVNLGGIGGTFNIEGAALTPEKKLLLGFRSPLHARNENDEIGDAIVIALTNPHEIFDSSAAPQFEATAQYLPLNGQGIRAMYYDTDREGCWIVSGASANAVAVAAEPWHLWFWDLVNAPVRKEIDSKPLKNAEGVCRMKIGEKDGLLFTEDAGKDEGGNALPCHYMLMLLPD